LAELERVFEMIAGEYRDKGLAMPKQLGISAEEFQS